MIIKTVLFSIITAILLSFSSPHVAQAQNLKTPYEDYLFNYSRYQTELDKLNTAKAGYKKDASLINLTNLLESTRTLYLSIGDTMIAYSYFLQSETVDSNVVPAQTMDFFNATLLETTNWYIDQKSVINGLQNDRVSMQKTIDEYNSNQTPILVKVNQLRLIANSARIAKSQDQARTLLAKLFTHINNTITTPDPRQEVWKNQIIERVNDTNNLIKQNFELIPQINKVNSGNQINSNLTKNSKMAIENIRKIAGYLNEINNSL